MCVCVCVFMSLTVLVCVYVCFCCDLVNTYPYCSSVIIILNRLTSEAIVSCQPTGKSNLKMYKEEKIDTFCNFNIEAIENVRFCVYVFDSIRFLMMERFSLLDRPQ